ncbi:unnamed protein product [Ilex paraguariensis]|uniref:Cucumisin n=1 Tax=Ilex paraguariensis TaxID=185542 RepID=A0ABC8UBR2_9AQUA
MGHHSHPNSESVITANHEVLASIVGSIHGAQEVAVHHYTKSFRGFSAMLTTDQAQQLAERNSVVSVFESRMNKIHTTHSWQFLGIDYIQQYNQLPMEVKSNVIVGVVDTGVWPESHSFSDSGLGPVPKKFKGECVTGDAFTSSNCNRKIVGARFYSKGFEAEFGPLESINRTFFRSPRDSDGHGTHTASTVAGSLVANASLLGIGGGSARGGTPGARLAIYKACWFGGCSGADILSALDDAIDDGVDILSLSIGQLQSEPGYFQDPISIGSFHAFQKGILVSAAAGNYFFPRTATNVAPWILTVGASTIDRELQSNIYLGNSKSIRGFGLNPQKMESYYGLIAGSAAAAPGIPARNARDSDGHGTHTASTVAGSLVANASLLGIGGGSARGGTPGARLAIYKACWFGGCSGADILSALDDAIDDGVDILSLSIGQLQSEPGYFQDPISIGSFHAFQKGILVSAAAGNYFFPRTATNVAPWILTVGASTIDRELQSNIYLGNSKSIRGFGLNPQKMESYYGLIAGSAAAAPGIPARNASFCKNNTLDPTLIKGKVVVCTVEILVEDLTEKAIFVEQGGGLGVILIDPVGIDLSYQFAIPATLIYQDAAEELQAYMATEK